jgi:hypothetical protein
MWIDEWLAQWACLADERRPLTELGRCERCRAWEPRHGRTAGEPVDPQEK